MDELERFAKEVDANISGLKDDRDLQGLSNIWVREIARHRYAYNFRWMGRPIIQFPQDMIAMQELVWEVKPDVIVETGIAHGGSLLYYASLLELLGGSGTVLGIDVEIRAHNRAEIEKHPMAKRVSMIQGSSIDSDVAKRVHDYIRLRDARSVIVVLDSNHTHAHVLEELRLYSPLVTPGSYLVVFDTIIEDMPAGSFPDRPWDRGNNPKTAVTEFLANHAEFEVVDTIPAKLLITVAPGGYLRRRAVRQSSERDLSE